MSLGRNNGDALVGDMNAHPLTNGEARLLQPIATQAQKWDLRRTGPATVELILVTGAADIE